MQKQNGPTLTLNMKLTQARIKQEQAFFFDVNVRRPGMISLIHFFWKPDSGEAGLAKAKAGRKEEERRNSLCFP